MAGPRRLDIRDESGKRQKHLHRNYDDEEGEQMAAELVGRAEVSTGSSGPTNGDLTSRVALAGSSDEDEIGRTVKNNSLDGRDRGPTENIHAGFSLDAITEFNKDYACLHPDYPCNVAGPLQINDAGSAQPMVFYPSLSMAFMAIMRDIDKEMTGERSTPWTYEEADKWCRSRHNEVKDVLRLNRDKTALTQNAEKRMMEMVECLTRDKLRRDKGIATILANTGERQLIYSDASGPIFGELIESLIEPDEKFGRKYLVGANIIGRVLMKVREDSKQGFRGLMRWVIQCLPLERDLRQRIKLRVLEARGGGDDRCETTTSHDLDRKVDIREYFESGTKVDRIQLFTKFPQNEKEDAIDATFRRRKRQRLVDDMSGRDDAIDKGDDADKAVQSLFIGIGKLPENEIACLNPSVSKNHCFVVPLQRGVVVAIDVGSKGGTFVNNDITQPFVPVPLNPGDRIRVGQSARIFTVQFRVLNTAERNEVKRVELERQLASLTASLSSSGGSLNSDRERTIKLSGLPSNVTAEDIEDVLKAHHLSAADIKIQSTTTSFNHRNDSCDRSNDRSRDRPWKNNKYNRQRDVSALLVFPNKTDAWKAKESLNDRSIKGHVIVASWA